MITSLRDFDLLILLLLDQRPAHGHHLRQRLHLVERERAISASSVYYTLHKLEGNRLVQATVKDGQKAPSKKVYHLTAA